MSLSYSDQHRGTGNVYDETPYIDFNSVYPYYATSGHLRRGQTDRAHGRTATHALGHTGGGSPLATPTKRSRHVPQPMDDAPDVFAPTVRVDDESHLLLRTAAISPYHQSVSARQPDSGNRLRVSFRDAAGKDRPPATSPRPADIARTQRSQLRRELNDEDEAWVRSAGRYAHIDPARAPGLRRNSLQLDHDSSGDDQDAELVALPDPPEVEAERALRAAAEPRRPVATTPWQFHPDMDVPLSLLLQRGVSIVYHQGLLDYHMHPAFLADVGFVKNGTTIVKYPRTVGAPHNRHVAVEMMKVGGGDAAFLTWRQHRSSTAIIDRVQLAHLVGVTVGADASSAFGRFRADPTSERGRKRAMERWQRPHDATHVPSPLPHYTLDLATPDTTMVGATAAGSTLRGPTIEDNRKSLVRCDLCFTLWFVDPRTREARSVDLAAHRRAEWARWVDAMRGIIAINDVRVAAGMTDEDRHGRSAAEAEATDYMDDDDAISRARTQRSIAAPSDTMYVEPSYKLIDDSAQVTGRTAALMQLAFETLERRGEEESSTQFGRRIAASDVGITDADVTPSPA